MLNHIVAYIKIIVTDVSTVEALSVDSKQKATRKGSEGAMGPAGGRPAGGIGRAESQRSCCRGESGQFERFGSEDPKASKQPSWRSEIQTENVTLKILHVYIIVHLTCIPKIQTERLYFRPVLGCTMYCVV